MDKSLPGEYLTQTRLDLLLVGHPLLDLPKARCDKTGIL